MLCLSAKVGDEIVIAEKIVLRIERLNGSRVQLSFDGDPNIPIDRRKIHDAKHAEIAAMIEETESEYRDCNCGGLCDSGLPCPMVEKPATPLVGAS